jgi:hypothetical protein
MLYVEYDEQYGTVVPDGQVAKRVLKWIENYCDESVSNVCVGSDVMVNQFRLMVIDGILKHDELMFIYKDIQVPVDRYAKMNCPKGMCDLNMDQMFALIDGASKVKRAETEAKTALVAE